MAADPAGNVYSLGAADDAAGATHDVVRAKAAGSDQWTTILDAAHTGDWWGIRAATVAADGDVYLARSEGPGARILEWDRSTGATSYAAVADLQAANGGYAASVGGMAAAANGDVFAVGQSYVPTGAKGKTPAYQCYWTVWKQAGGEGAFVPVSIVPAANRGTSTAHDVAVIPSGPAAGIYVVGSVAQDDVNWSTSNESSGTHSASRSTTPGWPTPPWAARSGRASTGR